MKLELRPEQEPVSACSRICVGICMGSSCLLLQRQPLLPPSVCSPSHQKGRAGALLPQSSSRMMLKRQERCHDSRAEGSCTEPLSAGSRVTPALFPFTLCLLSALSAVSKQSAAAVWPDIPARGVKQAAALLCECTAKLPDLSESGAQHVRLDSPDVWQTTPNLCSQSCRPTESFHE